jgi:hypothetical protein
VVPAGGGNLQRAARAFLPLDVDQIGDRAPHRDRAGLRRGQGLPAGEMVDQVDQGGRGQHLGGTHPGRLAAAGAGADQPLRLRRGGDGSGQRALNRPDLAELQRRHQRQRDGQVVMRTGLRQVGRRQVDGDPLRRHRQPDGGQRGAHPLTRFRHRLVRQPNDIEGVQPRCQRTLHFDRLGLDAEERHRMRAGDHASPHI